MAPSMRIEDVLAERMRAAARDYGTLNCPRSSAFWLDKLLDLDRSTLFMTAMDRDYLECQIILRRFMNTLAACIKIENFSGP